MKPLLIAECHFDTLIIKVVTEQYGWHQNEEFGHEEGTEVFRAMERRNSEKKGITVGFFDKNSKMNENVYIASFTDIYKDKDGVQWIKNPDIIDQHIFYLPAGAEKWFLQAAESGQVLPDNYKVPDNFKALGKLTKRIGINSNDNLTAFVNAVVDANPPQIQTLRKYIIKAFDLKIS